MVNIIDIRRLVTLALLLSLSVLLRRPGMFGLVAYDFFLFYPEESKGEMDILDIIIGTQLGGLN